MSKITFNYSPGRGAMTQQLLRSTCQQVHDGFLQAGLQVTTDTGQADLASVIMSTADWANQLLGYRIYELVDALSPQRRFLMRVEYWQVSRGGIAVVNSELFLQISAGTTTDGAGGLGSESIRLCSAPVANNFTMVKSASVPSFIYTAEGVVGVAVGCQLLRGNDNPGPSNRMMAAGLAIVSRTRNSEGAFTPDGLTGIGGGTAKPTWFNIMYSHAVVPGSFLLQDGAELCGYVSLSSLASVNGAAVLQHPMVATPGIYPLREVGIYPAHNQFAVGDTLTCQVAGAMRKYVALGDTPLCPGVIGIANPAGGPSTYLYGSTGLAMAWDD